MSQGRAKPLLATETGQDVTDKLRGITRSLAVYSPSLEDLLQQIVDHLAVLIEFERVKRDGI